MPFARWSRASVGVDSAASWFRRSISLCICVCACRVCTTGWNACPFMEPIHKPTRSVALQLHLIPSRINQPHLTAPIPSLHRNSLRVFITVSSWLSRAGYLIVRVNYVPYSPVIALFYLLSSIIPEPLAARPRRSCVIFGPVKRNMHRIVKTPITHTQYVSATCSLTRCTKRRLILTKTAQTRGMFRAGNSSTSYDFKLPLLPGIESS